MYVCSIYLCIYVSVYLHTHAHTHTHKHTHTHTHFFQVLYRKFEQRNRKSYSLKNKYRNCGSESKDKLTFADEYALEEFPANSFATLDPGILRNRPDPGAMST